MNESFNDLFAVCPFTTAFSQFERENFLAPSGHGYARFIIDVINRYRKIESDYEFEDRIFERNCLLEEKNRIEKFLESQDVEQMKVAVENWQKYEADYWADTLGKIAAVEILTSGKATYDTMLKMAQLPKDSYIKATQICVKLANAISQATEEAEHAIGVFKEIPQTTDLAPKSLSLKKIK